MDFQNFVGKIGTRYSVVNGDLTESSTGEFVVSESFGYNTIYLNKIQKTCQIVTEPGSYVAKEYKLKYTDCITLFAEWLDKYRGSNFGNIYQKLSRKQWLYYYEAGMKHWYLDNNFKEVTDLQEGDCLVYECYPGIKNHVGIYVNSQKILHHIPQKLSSLDTLDSSLIIGAYRYGN